LHHLTTTTRKGKGEKGEMGGLKRGFLKGKKESFFV